MYLRRGVPEYLLLNGSAKVNVLIREDEEDPNAFRDLDMRAHNETVSRGIFEDYGDLALMNSKNTHLSGSISDLFCNFSCLRSA
jgi:hypothetical protein